MVFVHSPPLMHGFGKQSSISLKKKQRENQKTVINKLSCHNGSLIKNLIWQGGGVGDLLFVSLLT